MFRFDNKTYSRQLASASSGRAKPKRCQPSLARSSPRSRLRGRGAAGPRSPSLAAARRPATKTRAWSERATSDDLHSLIYQPAVAPFVVLSRTGHATPTAAAHACRLQCGIFTGIIPGFYFFDLFSEAGMGYRRAHGISRLISRPHDGAWHVDWTVHSAHVTTWSRALETPVDMALPHAQRGAQRTATQDCCPS